MEIKSTRHTNAPLILVVFVFLFLSCSEQSIRPSETSLTPSISTISPTKTFLTPSTPTFTETSEFETNSQTRCQEIISSQLQTDFGGNGSIIFEGECEGSGGLFKLNIEDQKIAPFLSDNKYGKSVLGSGITPFYVSKDHQWLMYEYRYYDDNDTYLGTFINVTGENENSLIQYPLNENWVSLWGWYNNNLAGFTVFRAPNVSIDILDPFSGKLIRFSYPFWGYERAELLFDPSVARVLYFDDREALRYRLKEIATDKVIWESVEDRTSTVFAGHPQWSPNGLFFAIPIWDQTNNGEYRFLAVSREGKEIVTDRVFQVNDKSPYVKFIWSDSGKYLVFWNSTGNAEKQLIIWDVAKNYYIDTGFKTQYDAGLPIFSPDETQFIINIATSEGDQNSNRVNYLSDLVNGKSIKLDIGLYPVAWLKPAEPSQKIIKPADEPSFLPPKSGSSVTQQPLKIEDSAKSFSQFDGSLVFSQDHLLYTVSSHDNRSLIDTHPLMDAFVSPDRKSLFYWYKDESADFTPHYWLVSSNGQKTEVVNQNIVPSQDAISGWFNDQELWVETKSDSEPVLFNPYQNTYRARAAFADPQIAGCIDWYICYGIGNYLPDFYDASFERKVLVGTAYLMLIDRDAKTLWQHENWLITLNIPKWSPDQQKIGVPLPLDETGEHYEFFTVDKDGRASQLTNYLAAYPVLAIDKFQWSPDGRYVAFWGDTRSMEGIAQRNPYRLFVLDTQNRQTIDYSVIGNYANNSAPIWSPDGTQIAVNSVRNGKRMIFIVDFVTGIVAPIAEGKLIGWMTRP